MTIDEGELKVQKVAEQGPRTKLEDDCTTRGPCTAPGKLQNIIFLLSCIILTTKIEGGRGDASGNRMYRYLKLLTHLGDDSSDNQHY